MSDRPWLDHYPAGVPGDIPVDAYPSLVALMEEAFQRHASLPAYKFMGLSLSFGELDALSLEIDAARSATKTRAAASTRPVPRNITTSSTSATAA